MGKPTNNDARSGNHQEDQEEHLRSSPGYQAAITAESKGKSTEPHQPEIGAPHQVIALNHQDPHKILKHQGQMNWSVPI